MPVVLATRVGEAGESLEPRRYRFHGAEILPAWVTARVHPQQTDTRTENETPHILTHRWVMKNENTWTQKGEY